MEVEQSNSNILNSEHFEFPNETKISIDFVKIEKDEEKHSQDLLSIEFTNVKKHQNQSDSTKQEHNCLLRKWLRHKLPQNTL